MGHGGGGGAAGLRDTPPRGTRCQGCPPGGAISTAESASAPLRPGVPPWHRVHGGPPGPEPHPSALTQPPAPPAPAAQPVTAAPATVSVAAPEAPRTYPGVTPGGSWVGPPRTAPHRRGPDAPARSPPPDRPAHAGGGDRRRLRPRRYGARPAAPDPGPRTPPSWPYFSSLAAVLQEPPGRTPRASWPYSRRTARHFRRAARRVARAAATACPPRGECHTPSAFPPGVRHRPVACVTYS